MKRTATSKFWLKQLQLIRNSAETKEAQLPRLLRYLSAPNLFDETVQLNCVIQKQYVPREIYLYAKSKYLSPVGEGPPFISYGGIRCKWQGGK